VVASDQSACGVVDGYTVIELCGEDASLKVLYVLVLLLAIGVIYFGGVNQSIALLE
jgi:hypothetical protein